MKKIFFSLVCAGALLFSMPACKSGDKPNEGTSAPEQQASVYQCPMQCEGDKTYDKPGKCPVCGMELRPIEVKAPVDSTHATGDSVRAV
jgi:protein SCO1/2